MSGVSARREASFLHSNSNISLATLSSVFLTLMPRAGRLVADQRLALPNQSETPSTAVNGR